MENKSKRIELPFNSAPVAVLAAINTELDAIDLEGGEVSSFVERFSRGMNKIVIDMVYSSGFEILNSFLLDANLEFFTVPLAPINSVISGVNKTFALNIGLKADNLGVTDYIFSDNGFNITLRKNATNTLQMVLRDSAFKSATSLTALDSVSWFFISIVYDGNLALGNRCKIYLNGMDDTNADNTTNTIDLGTIDFELFAKAGALEFGGNLFYASLLDIAPTPTQMLALYNGGEPLDSQLEYGANCKWFFNPDNSGAIAQFTVSDAVNLIDSVSSGMENGDKVLDTPY